MCVMPIGNLSLIKVWNNKSLSQAGITDNQPLESELDSEYDESESSSFSFNSEENKVNQAIFLKNNSKYISGKWFMMAL